MTIKLSSHFLHQALTSLLANSTIGKDNTKGIKTPLNKDKTNLKEEEDEPGIARQVEYPCPDQFWWLYLTSIYVLWFQLHSTYNEDY